jgi:hypothetical protein
MTNLVKYRRQKTTSFCRPLSSFCFLFFLSGDIFSAESANLVKNVYIPLDKEAVSINLTAMNESVLYPDRIIDLNDFKKNLMAYLGVKFDERNCYYTNPETDSSLIALRSYIKDIFNYIQIDRDEFDLKNFIISTQEKGLLFYRQVSGVIKYNDMYSLCNSNMTLQQIKDIENRAILSARSNEESIYIKLWLYACDGSLSRFGEIEEFICNRHNDFNRLPNLVSGAYCIASFSAILRTLNAVLATRNSPYSSYHSIRDVLLHCKHPSTLAIMPSASKKTLNLYRQVYQQMFSMCL